MKIYNYNEWKATAETLHMVLQMIGKTKLSLLPKQPEWGQILITPTGRGFTSELISDGRISFDINVDILSSMVEAESNEGKNASFLLRNDACVNEYYEDFMEMLKDIGVKTKFSTIPQECAYDTPFEKQLEKRDFDAKAARAYFDNCLFAYNALTKFASPYRGKKLLPGLFFGTYDMTTVLFSGLEKPFPGNGFIEKVAFTEQIIEFGFWPGDDKVPEPHFFVLPYPFLKQDLSGAEITPKEAFYSKEKKEFFLSLNAVMQYDNPTEVVVKFCQKSFDIVTKAEGWENVDWWFKPIPR